ncbi:MAG: respiratory nitrate reductase subunit gamma [Treponemataceae bacterium]
MQADAVAAASNAAEAGVSAAADAVSAASADVPLTAFGIVLSKIEYFVTVPMVYLAILFFAAAAVYKIVSIFSAPAPGYAPTLYPLKKRPMMAAMSDAFAMPQVRKHAPVFWVFLMVYHVAFILLILGHLDILPSINIVDPESKHMLGAGAVGVGVTLPMFYFIIRRFSGEVRRISTPADYLLLFLLLFLFLLGDMISWGNSWTAHGFVMTKADFSLYFDGLVRFTFDDPRKVLPGSHFHFVVLHVLLANVFFIVLPFSKVMHVFLSLPINILRRKPWTAK